MIIATQSLRNLKKQLRRKDVKIKELQKKLKLFQQRKHRLKVCVQSLKIVIKCLRQKQLISTGCEEVLKQSFSGVPLELMKRVTSGRSGNSFKFSAELCSFALTLQFYSIKAFGFRSLSSPSRPNQRLVM